MIFLSLMFCSSHFSFLVFGHFWQQSYQNTKILCNLCLHFARQDGQDGKKGKENHATKVTKRRKYGMNETLKRAGNTKFNTNLTIQAVYPFKFKAWRYANGYII